MRFTLITINNVFYVVGLCYWDIIDDTSDIVIEFRCVFMIFFIVFLSPLFINYNKKRREIKKQIKLDIKILYVIL
jgi:hypothetical protein